MQITRKTDYAIRAVRALYKVDGRIANAKTIAEMEQIPLNFLLNIMQVLSKERIVETHRGVGGGYSLLADPKEITINSIVEIFEGPFKLNECTVNNCSCYNSPECKVRDEFVRIEEIIKQELQRKTLHDILV